MDQTDVFLVPQLSSVVDCDVFIQNYARGGQAEGGRYGLDSAAGNFLMTCVEVTLRETVRFTRGHFRCNGPASPSTKCGSVQSYDGTE